MKKNFINGIMDLNKLIFYNQIEFTKQKYNRKALFLFHRFE